MSVTNGTVSITGLDVAVIVPSPSACAVDAGDCNFAAGPIALGSGGALTCRYSCAMPAGYIGAQATARATFSFTSAEFTTPTPVEQTAEVTTWDVIPVDGAVWVLDPYLTARGLFTPEQLFASNVTRAARFDVEQPVECGCGEQSINNTALLSITLVPSAGTIIASASKAVTVPACPGSTLKPGVFTTPSPNLTCACALDWCGAARGGWGWRGLSPAAAPARVPGPAGRHSQQPKPT